MSGYVSAGLSGLPACYFSGSCYASGDNYRRDKPFSTCDYLGYLKNYYEIRKGVVVFRSFETAKQPTDC